MTMDYFMVGILVTVGVVAVGAMIAAVLIEKDSRATILQFAQLLIGSLLALIGANIGMKVYQTSEKVDAAAVIQEEIATKQDTIAAKADVAAEKADVAAAKAEETASVTAEVKETTDATKMMVETKLGPME